MQGNRPEPTGLFVPATNTSSPTTPPSSGLIIPDRAWAAGALGLHPVPEQDLWRTDLIGVYLVADEYLRPALKARGQVFDRDAWISALLQLHSTDEYLCMLAALNHATNDADQANQCRQRFVARLTADIAERIQHALEPEAGRPQRPLLTRQVVLRTMHLVLVPPDASPTPDLVAAAGGMLDGIDIETATVLLTHLVGDQLGRERHEGEPRLGGLPESLAMELIANNLFYDHGDAGALLARTRLLWTGYGDRLQRVKLRRRPVELLEEATGLSFDDMTALAFAYYAYILDHGPGKAIRMHASTNILVDQNKIETFLSRFASTPEELATALRSCPQRWQLLPLQDRPLLRLGDDIVVLDEHHLLERITLGLYWLVHDHEKTQHGEAARLLWTQAYAEMVETRVEDQLRTLAPPLVGSKDQTFFTEENLQKAFSAKGKTASSVDAGIDFGDAVVLVEVVSASVSVPTRELADVAAFRADVEKIVLKKARQLDATAANLLRDPQPAESPIPAPALRIFPVAVRGGQFAVNRVTSHYVDECISEEGLFTDARVRALALLDLDELDASVALSQHHHLTLARILQDWQESDCRDESLRTYIALRAPKPLDHSDDVSAALTETFSAIGDRLGIHLTDIGNPDPATADPLDG